ncbi:MAG: hypothetical protein AB1861_09310 [Cyanobacteriota bacterium]
MQTFHTYLMKLLKEKEISDKATAGDLALFERVKNQSASSLAV